MIDVVEVLSGWTVQLAASASTSPFSHGLQVLHHWRVLMAACCSRAKVQHAVEQERSA